MLSKILKFSSFTALLQAKDIGIESDVELFYPSGVDLPMGNYCR